jgi:hypothetical protein
MPLKEFTNRSFGDALGIVRMERYAETGIAFAADTPPAPHELHEVYNRGFRGVQPETISAEQRNATRDMMAAMPRLYEVFPWAKGIGKGKVNLPYLAMLHFDPEWGGDEAQQSGCCTVHGTINAATIDYAMDALMGETTYKGRLVKEAVWRSRGYNGDGWSCQEPSSWFGPNGEGGFLYRKVYEGPNGESLDFTKYSEKWCSNGRAGVPQWLLDICQQSKARWIIPITTMEEYRDSHALGFGINICSGQGFSSTTDDHGVAEARGSWSHSMGHTGNVDTEWAHEECGDLIGADDQSWGLWNKQNGKPEGVARMAPGMFYARAKAIAGMLRGDDYSICGVAGWDRDPSPFERNVLLDHLRTSAVQDYYKARQERVHAMAEQAMAGEPLQ